MGQVGLTLGNPVFCLDYPVLRLMVFYVYGGTPTLGKLGAN